MGFIIPKAKQITVKLNGDYKGAEFTCITKPSMATMIAITMGESEDIAAPMMSFGDLVLVSWNLETEDGAIEPTGEGMLSLDADLSGAILAAWSDEVANPTESANE
jgi:hypothetical protein